MHAGLERNRIRKHLLVFALAAPVLAMLTFLGLSQVNVQIPVDDFGQFDASGLQQEVHFLSDCHLF